MQRLQQAQGGRGFLGRAVVAGPVQRSLQRLQSSAVVDHGAKGVDALSPGRALPAAALVMLIILFCNLVLDRICYSTGSNAGKAMLHMIEVPLYFAGGWLLFWNADTDNADRGHLKVWRPRPC